MLSKILKNTLVKNTITLVSGGVIAQIVALFCTPILSRYFTPEEFGVLGGVLTVSSILTVVICMKYEMAIVLSSDSIERNQIVTICMAILISFSCIVFPVFYLYPETLVWLGLTQTNNTLISLLCLLVLGTGIQKTFYQLHVKLGNYKLLSINRVVQKLAIVLVQLIFALFFMDELGLIWGYVLGFGFSLPFLIYSIRNELKFNFFNSKLLEPFKRYYRFPLFNAPQSMLNSVSQGLPVLMLGKFFNLEQVGLYFFTVRILQLPSSIIGGSIRQVFYKRASEIKSDSVQIKKEFFKTTKGLFTIILGPMIIIFSYGSEIFSFVFGEEWRVAGEYSRWMVLWIGAGFINPPAMSLYLIYNKQGHLFVMETILFVSRFAVLYLFAQKGNMLHTIQMYSLVGLVYNLFIVIYGFTFVKKRSLL